jgi:hypothetical protein
MLPILDAMPSDQPPENETLLASVLKPLLDDFQYWFQRSLQMLEQETLHFLPQEQQTALIERLRTALSETHIAASLLRATEGQVGVEASKVMAWHALVAECWAIARRRRAEST